MSKAPRVKVNDVLNFVINEYKLDKNEFYEKLGAKGLLPKTINISETVVKDTPKFASQAATILAAQHGIIPDGTPPGKRGWTKSDIQKVIDTTTTQNLLPRISKAAKELAEDHKIDWTVITGTSKKGTITKSDITDIIKKNATDEHDDEHDDDDEHDTCNSCDESGDDESDDELPPPPIKKKNKNPKK